MGERGVIGSGPGSLERRRSAAIQQADLRMRETKARISLAALACIRGAIDAPRLVQAALQEVEAARALLAEAMEAEA